MDNTVPHEYGYDLYYENFGDDPDFEFDYVEGAGHNDVLKNSTIKEIIDFYDSNLT